MMASFEKLKRVTMANANQGRPLEDAEAWGDRPATRP